MAKNIYDLFNERKYGVDYLVEGVDGSLEEVKAYESIEEAVEGLEMISQESTNEAIELQAAWYLEELVIESMMYDNFEEERIGSVMEGALKEKANKAAEYIKKKWQQIKEWFASTFKAISNHFMSGEKFVAKYKNEIPDALRNATAKIKMPEIVGIHTAAERCAVMISQLKSARISGEGGKEKVLNIVGVDDKKGVGEKIKGIFFPGEVKERNVSDFSRNPELLMEWAGDRKKIVDAFKKQQKAVDEDFKEILGNLKQKAKDASAEGRDAANEIVSNFNFGLGIKNTILSTELACIKQGSKMCLAIIKKAMGKQAEAEAENPDKTARDAEGNQLAIGTRADNADGESQRLKDRKATAALKQQQQQQQRFESFVPQLEGYEFLDDNNNEEWDW